MRDHLRHHLNPLHLYCRLMDSGVEHGVARRICTWYERVYVFFL